ncbi:MAG: histidine kinase [Rubripirellula sp.]
MQWIYLIALQTTWLVVSHATSPYRALSHSQLETLYAESLAEEEQLASATFRSGVGNLGWQSRRHPSGNVTEWAQVDLDDESLIDLVVLAPVLWRDSLGVIQADGFPIEFKVFIGKEGDLTGKEVASFGPREHLLPRNAPVMIPIHPTPGSWVRVEASQLSQGLQVKRYLCQFSEIMVFSGEENVATGCSTMASSVSWTRVNQSIDSSTLVDGFMPYLMNAARGDGSPPYVAFFLAKDHVSFTLDLGNSRRINRIHLHSADQNANVPKIHHTDYALPDHLVISGANQADFSDEVLLSEYKKKSIYDSGPILIRKFSARECRFVRLTAMRGYQAPEASKRWRCMGFTEIEIFENSRNVAAGVLPSVDGPVLTKDGPLQSLTDGHNHFGPILTLREWMSQLARRHDLANELSQLRTEIDDRSAKQNRNFRWALGIIAGMIATTISVVVWARINQVRQAKLLKRRFAADLHDGLGADLHSIGLLSDLAHDAAQSPEKLKSMLAEIRCVTKDASASLRYMSRTENEDAPYSNLMHLMEQAVERIAVGLDHQLQANGTEYLESLRPQTRADLLAFYKECIVNVSRHASATKLVTTLQVSSDDLRLTVVDDGQGLPTADDRDIPASLLRRAKLFGAQVCVNTVPTGGTSVHLVLQRARWRRWFQ